MAYKIYYSARVENDIKEALTYYGEINVSLSNRFYNQWIDACEKLSKNPQHYSYISKTSNYALRDIKLPSFPYVIIYRILEDTVAIVAVRNCHSKPLKF